MAKPHLPGAQCLPVPVLHHLRQEQVDRQLQPGGEEGQRGYQQVPARFLPHWQSNLSGRSAGNGQS